MLRAGELMGRFDRSRSLCDAVQSQLASSASLDDPRPNIWTALAVTYENLDDDQARAFQMVGLLDGIAIDAPLLAAALGQDTTEEKATQLLRGLVGRNLLEPIGRDADRWLPSWLLRRGADHWLPHSLVRVYACAMASLDLPEEERQAAVTRTAPVILQRAKGLADLLDSSLARVYPELAALAQAAMDEEWEHGAAIVDRAVAEGLDLLTSLQDEGELLFELLSRPHMLRTDDVIDNLAKAADSVGQQEVARRARSLREAEPEPPPAPPAATVPSPAPAEPPTIDPVPAPEMSPTDPSPEPPRAWGVAIWAEGFSPRTQVTLTLDGHVVGQSYTDGGGAITDFETTSPGPTPPESLRVSGWVERGGPSPTCGFTSWPIY